MTPLDKARVGGDLAERNAPAGPMAILDNSATYPRPAIPIPAIPRSNVDCILQTSSICTLNDSQMSRMLRLLAERHGHEGSIAARQHDTVVLYRSVGVCE